MGACQTRIVFGMGDVEEAGAMARQVIEFDLTEPKPGFVSHQTIGHKVRWLTNTSTAFGSGQSVGQQWGEGTTRTETKADAEHWIATEGIAIGRGFGAGVSHAQAIGVNTGETSLEDGTIVVLNHAQGISDV